MRNVLQMKLKVSRHTRTSVFARQPNENSWLLIVVKPAITRFSYLAKVFDVGFRVLQIRKHKRLAEKRRARSGTVTVHIALRCQLEIIMHFTVCARAIEKAREHNANKILLRKKIAS